jgi:hypothetical protein
MIGDGQMAFDYDRPLLTMRQVKEWQEEKSRLEMQIAALQQELAAINKKLDAAAALSEEVAALDIKTYPPVVHISGNGTGAAQEQEPMTHAVVRIIDMNSQPMKPTAIKKILAREGYEKKRLNNYLYTVLHRLLAQGRIRRQGVRYSLPMDKASEPESREAPSDAA